MTICSVHTIIRWLKESRSAWVWSSSSSETYMHFPRTQWNPRCCTSWTSSLSLYKHYAWPVFGKSLFMIIMCKDAWLCRITAISKYPGIGPLDLNSHQTFFFSFSSSSHNLLRLSFFTECWFSASSHQMKNTCSGLLVPVFLFPCLFNGKGKTEDNSLLCKRVL